MSFPRLFLKPQRDRSVRNRHPWLFSGAVARSETEEPGAVVEIRSHEGETLAWGHYEPKAALRCRLFHFGGAAPASNAAYWRGKLDAAARWRDTCIDRQRTDAFRLVNAEGDGLPGLVVDVYAGLAVAQLRTSGMQGLQEIIADWLTDQGRTHVYRKDDAEDLSGWLRGGVEEVECREDGLTLFVRPESGQKTGYYLDQRENRRGLAPWLTGRRVLNAFSYTGGFALHALRAGAAEVESVDVSAAVKPLVERHISANFGAEAPHRFVAADCFDYLRQTEAGRFNAIILDPPAFTKHVSTVDRAARGYKDLNLRALKLLPIGGLLATFSCSQHVGGTLFRQILFAAAADAGRRVRLVRAFGHGPDHPVDIFHPEGEYLKGWLLEVGE